MEKEELNLDQLEVGEWYELKGSANWLKWFSKHKGIHDGDCETSSEFIQQSSGLGFKKHAYTWCSGYTFRKATKEQLKSFLPKDHPDYPIDKKDYKWILFLEDRVTSTNFEKGEIDEIRTYLSDINVKKCNYIISGRAVENGSVKLFKTKEEAQNYWDKLNQSEPVETPKTKQLSDLKKGDWVKFIFNENTSNFKKGDLYKLNRDWDNGAALIIDAKGNGNGFGNDNLVNFTVPTQQEIDTWEKSLIKDEPKEFVLPEKWCIRVGMCSDNKLISDWRITTGFGSWVGSVGYLNYSGLFSNDKPNYTEITFEQFEKYVLKAKVTVEDKPKEDMKTIPKYWYIENKYQEVRDYLADTYNESCIKNWTFDFIGWDESPFHKGCHGFRIVDGYVEKATKITIEQFREYFLKKPKEVSQDDYSWWSELEVGDVIESLSEKGSLRQVGDKFTIIKVEEQRVYYQEHTFSDNATTWKLISKAKDKVKEPSIHRIETTITTSPNWYEKSINDEPIAQFCPQPEETEIVPISKYFKIRN